MAFRYSSRVLLATAALALRAVGAHAQAQPPADTLAEARRLRDAHEFTSAADLLGPFASAHPDMSGVAWLAAQTLYWAKRPAEARSYYELALANAPDDPELRLDYGRYLVETNDGRRAREVLQPAAETPASRGRALALLGTLAYWSGDLTSARRTFRDALRADSSLTDARRQLAEIELAAAPSLQVGATAWRDDQPLHHTDIDGELRWYATPLAPFSVRARSMRFDADGITQTLSAAEVSATVYVPRAHLDLAAAGGVLRRPFSDTTDWTGRVTLGVRMPHGIDVQARGERVAYLYTTASLGSPLMTESIAGVARWRPSSGWLGEAGVTRETFPDDNGVTSAYVWTLAPLARGADGAFSAGYGFAAQSADESRFVARNGGNLPPGQVQPSIPGEYNPYYTPRNLRAHSALVLARIHPGRRWTLEANGSFAVSAHDDAPVLRAVVTPPNVQVVRTFSLRSFHPWNVRGSLEGALSDALRLGIRGEHGRGAYYSYNTVGVQLTYTFVTSARRRAAGL